jgi:hypothetical protein
MPASQIEGAQDLASLKTRDGNGSATTDGAGVDTGSVRRRIAAWSGLCSVWATGAIESRSIVL